MHTYEGHEQLINIWQFIVHNKIKAIFGAATLVIGSHLAGCNSKLVNKGQWDMNVKLLGDAHKD